jgi:5-methylcytosine-specific restriction endonuclease McrA
MIIKRKVCAGWDDNTHPAFIWKKINGKPYCKNCTLRLEPPKPIEKRYEIAVKTSIKKISDKQKEKNKIKKENTALLHKVMYEWWGSFGDYKSCECCGATLPKEFSTINVHHLLPKAKYKEVALNTDYFMLLCQKCHSEFETSPSENKHKIIYDKTKIAKEKYNERTR